MPRADPQSAGPASGSADAGGSAHVFALLNRSIGTCNPELRIAAGIEDRIEAIDRRRVAANLDALFRNMVIVARHGFGRGEYRYFAYPLPELIGVLREAFHRRLAPMANRWHEAMGMPARFPEQHADFIARCHVAGQRRPTPLLLKYGAGDYNCLHQDLYGEHVFPLQVVVLLSRPGRDFDGGEFVMTEQRPRMQSRAMVLPLRQGAVAVIAVHHRPVQGTRRVPCQPQTWREPGWLGAPPYRRHHLPRRGMTRCKA